ncbi:MAG: sigma-70 family RNA polymerase sigma factor [Nitrospira sp.]|nr:MAG: sigma-70 family RNA polymerase sigma factor [Nitrospira sp.]
MKQEGGFAHSHNRASDTSSQRFEDLLMAHLGALYATALNLTKDRVQAEDLVQETSLKAWRNRTQLTTPQAVKGWLFKILMNTFINTYRKLNREPEFVDVELSEGMLEQVPSDEDHNQLNPLNRILSQCLETEIQEAFDQLTADIRSVVWLSDVEEFSYREIAEMMNCSMGTVASRLFRGRTRLRESLSDYSKQRGMIKE